ncbi:MAG: DUF2934 domain-containing protein [Gammaproteobacteria bacterium]|nr:DUF2934 domain-containing protein [Gammaproteobacteria bacterium]
MSKGNKGSTIDAVKYDETRDYLKDAFEHMLAAGHSVREFSEFTLGKFGDSFLPYLRRFLSDVDQGRIKIERAGASARSALFGAKVTAEERLEMIHLNAYLRAERRGFNGGSPEEDWIAAEREVDARLTREAGLVVKGQKAFTSALSTLETEFGSLKTTIADWIEKSAATASKPRKRPPPDKTAMENLAPAHRRRGHKSAARDTASTI